MDHRNLNSFKILTRQFWSSKVCDPTKNDIQSLYSVFHESLRCWCILIGKMFVYFKTTADQVQPDSRAPLIRYNLIQGLR